MAEVSWENINDYISEAWSRFKMNLPQVPIQFSWWETAKDGSKKCFIYFHDIKFKKVSQLKPAFISWPEFRVVVTQEFLVDQTTALDLAARIPSDASDESRLVLRIAYAILGAWQRHIFECYEKIERNKNNLTWVKAKEWYDKLEK